MRNKLTEDRITAASNILQQFAREGGLTATDTVRRKAVFAVYSVLTGIGAPAAEYAHHAADLEPLQSNAAPSEETTEPSVLPEDTNELNLGDANEDADNDYVASELEAMSVSVLKELAEEHGVEYGPRVSKKELIDLILKRGYVAAITKTV